MNDNSLAKLLEHFPDLFEELDQRCAMRLGLSIVQYEEMLRSVKYRVEYGEWDNKKILDISPDMCYSLMYDLSQIPFEDMRDCWKDLSYPEEPVTFCAFEISGEKVRDMYLKNVIALLNETELTGDSHGKTEERQEE